MQSIHTLGLIALVVLSSLIDSSVSEPRVVCYYTNWSVYRPGTAKFNPQNINPYLCTHLIYAFGGFTKDNQLKPFDKYQDIEQGGYAKFTGLKTYNKELKTMLAIGGWNEGSTRFSPLVASSERRSQLVKNAIKFLRQNKFDGLDLDWEYPAFRDGGKAKDRENYAKLVQELREEFQREHDKTGRPRLLLTMAVPAGFEYIEKGYDIPKLNKHLDWFNLLSYDYHSAYEPSVNHHAPLYPIEEENEYSYDTDLNINSTINFYVKAGADREKLVLGIPTYGRSYTLFNEESNEMGAPADGPGEQGDATREKGYLAYYEICQSLTEEDSEWTVVQPNSDALGPYAYNGNQWVGYDDEDIVRKKSKFVVEQNLGGIMFWSIDNDDFRGLCNGKAYPLIEAAKEAYLDSLANGVPTRNAIGSSKPKQTKVSTTTKRPESSKSKSSGKFTTPPPPTTPDPGSDFKCEEEGFYAHPRDCKKYFWCLEAAGLGIVAHQFTCPSGLYFNKAADSCDYSRNVHCAKASDATTTSTTTTEEHYTTTTRGSVSTRANSFYKSPSRTTTARTTTATYNEPITDIPELDQEDPKVIKELIDLIKKVGGVEELERQLNLQEDGASVTITEKNSQGSTTPSSIISKSLYDKIKNRASVLNKRPNFNGASQPERALEKTDSKEQKSKTTTTAASSATEASVVPKKYNSVNRFSRPSSQSAGIESLPESDAVLIEKPQYTSIRRKPAAKPAVISENDYNGDSENSREDSTTEKPQSESQKIYASINRSRRPQVQKVVKDIDESIEDEETMTTTTTKPTSKYLNLSRKRSTTEAPEIERTEQAAETTTTAFRRRTPASTQKTVLNLNNNRNQNQSENQDIKDTSRNTQKETLTGNNLREEFDEEADDEDLLNNIIALPTESVTENVPYPENILTTQPPAPPTTPPNSIQVTQSLIQTESLNDIIDDASNEIDGDTTTIINDLYISESGGLSKQNEIIKSNSLAPRPFSRPFLNRTRAPIVNESTSMQSEPKTFRTRSPIVNESTLSQSETSTRSFRTREPIVEESTNESTTRRIRSRPTHKFTTESNLIDNEIESTSRASYTYRPGYRGTARFRTSTVKSGQYDRLQEDLKLSNFQPVENNRLRALNLEKLETRSETSPAPEVTRRRLTPKARASTTTTETSVEQKETQSTKRRLMTRARFGSTTKEAIVEVDEETTTEQRIVEAKNYFNLAEGERPERIRFELAVGRKIDFGAISSAKTKSKTSDSSKVKVVTGPLDKSPLVSGRDYRQGHVEEIPLGNFPTTESVTIQSFSDKLELSEIPLNIADIESFVADEDLKTESPLDETTKKQRLRPSIKGFAKRTQSQEQEEEEITTQEAEDETTTPRATRLRPSIIGFAQKRTSTQAPSSSTTTTTEETLVESSSSRSRLAIGKTRFPARGKIETVKSADKVSVNEESTSRRTRPSAFQNRLSQRTRTTESSVNESEVVEENPVVNEESTSGRTRPLAFQNRFSQKSKTTESSVVVDESEAEEQNAVVNEDSTSGRTRPLAFQNRFSQRSKTTEKSLDVDENVSIRSRPMEFKTRLVTKSEKDIIVEPEDETVTTRARASILRSRFTTKSSARDSQALNSNNEDKSFISSRRPTAFRANSNRVIDEPKIKNEKPDDSNTEESTTSRVRFRPNQGKFLKRVKAEDIKVEDVNDLITESPLDETTLNFFNLLSESAGSRFAAASSNSVEDFESYNLVTALPDKMGDDDFTANSNREKESGEEEEDDETTSNSLIDATSTTFRSVVIRKRPVKKIDVATRQTITEAIDEETSKNTEAEAENNSEKNNLQTEPKDVEAADDDDDDEATTQEFDTTSEAPAAVVNSRPTPEILTRVRITTEATEENSQDAPEVFTKPTTTRQRIVFTRPQKIQSTNESENLEKHEENSETADDDEASKQIVGTVNKATLRTRPTRRVVTKARVTTESQDEELQEIPQISSSPRTTRKRIVFTRPRQNAQTTEEVENLDEENPIEESSQDASPSPRTTRKRISFTRTRPSPSTTEDAENLDENPIESNDEDVPEISSSPRTTRKRISFTRSRPSPSTTDEAENLDENPIESNDENSQDTPEIASSPRTTRKRIVFTRPRPNAPATNENDENLEKTVENPVESNDEETPEVIPSPRTTRKRISFTRPKPSTQGSEEYENDENRLSETSENSNVNGVEETSAKPNDFASRRKVKVFKTRPSTERSIQAAEEPINSKVFTTRTRVFKRPVLESVDQKQDGGDFELKTDDESVTPRANSRFGNDRQRKILKIKKLIADDNDETSQPELDASTAAPKKRLYKVLRTKTPKLLVDRPLIDDSSLIKTDDQSQDLDNENNFHENDQRFDNEENENADDSSGDSSVKPILRFPTRPSSVNKIVTIKRRPAFNLNSAKTSTIHPASAKFGKNPSPTKSRQVTIKRKFKPTSSSGSESTTDDIEPEKRIALGERNKKIFSKGYRKSLSTTQAPNITPLTDTDTTEPEDVVDTTDISLDNNDENILQKDTSAKPRFSLSRFTTTTIRPTTLHHVFAIDIEEDETASKTNKTTIKENNADEVIKKLQKLIEINRIVEVYSKEEKHKVLKNKKLKSIKQSDLTVERPPSVDKFGEISRETIIKLVKRNETVSTTEQPAVNQTRSPKNVVFAETVFSELESSTISLEGLFDREKKSNDNEEKTTTEAADLKVSSSSHVRAPVPLLRPESNETNPIIISLKSLDKVILQKVPVALFEQGRVKVKEEATTTETPEEETTLVDDN